MQINKNSWHYRFNLQWNRSNAFYSLRHNGLTSFCDYWSTTIVSMLGVAMMFTLMVGLISLLAVSTVSLVAFWLLPLVEFSFINYGFAASLGVGLPIVMTLCGIISVLTGEMRVFPNWIKKPFKAVLEYEDDSPCNKSVIKELYKAYKAKFCPIVTLKDD